MHHHVPGRLERPRLWLARRLFIGGHSLRLALALVPRNHPWRWWYESQADQLHAVTESTLHPRHRPAMSRAVPRYAMLSWAILYLAIADFVSVLPGLGLVDPDPVTPAEWLGLSGTPVDVPSLIELVGGVMSVAP